jgi:hypothetical protein
MNFGRLSYLLLMLAVMTGLPVFAADKTPPTKPVVTDAGTYTNSATNLHAKWTSSDPQSGIAKYKYHIREGSTTGPIMIDWTAVGLATEITRSGLSLRNGKTYYIGVKAINGEGNTSDVGYSDGITVQADSLPTPPASTPPAELPPAPSLPQPPPAVLPYQGFGANTRGGEGQPVYHVSNLNDSGPGSLRDALSQGNRHVVFDVGGEISLNSSLPVRGAFITIDGFTAPSPGVTLQNYGLSIDGNRGNHDIIVRGIRIREAGNSTDAAETDGLHVIHGAYNVVIDHVSIYGSEDGNLDIGTGAHDVTVSWSIFIKPAGTEKNMLIKYDPSRITLHHNLFLHARQRNPQVRIDNLGTPAMDTTLDMRNNVVWGWGNGYGTLVWYGPRANIVNNFYSNPSGSDNDAIRVCRGECDEGNPSSAARAYVDGNFSSEGVNLNVEGTESIPFSAPAVDISDACTAAHQVLADAGLPVRDSVELQSLGSISLSACSGS